MDKYIICLVLIFIANCSQSNENLSSSRNERLPGRDLVVEGMDAQYDKSTFVEEEPSTSVIDDQPFDSSATDQQHKVKSQDTISAVRRLESLRLEFDTVHYLSMSDTVYADLDGDGAKDKIFFSSVDKKRKLIFASGGHGLEKAIESTLEDSSGTANFDWVDFWGFTTDSVTYGCTSYEGISLGDVIILNNPSIILRVEELGGALITFADGKFRYIHQAD